MKRILGRLTYANVMATVAVFIALGGASYAAIKLPKNSVGAKQLKKGAVTPNKISKATEATLAGPRGATGPQGAPGPQGEPGTPATALTAQVDGSLSDLKLVRGLGATGVEQASGSGLFQVFFNRNVSGCTYQATRDRAADIAGEITVGPGNKANGVYVQTFNGNEQELNRGFYLAVFC